MSLNIPKVLTGLIVGNDPAQRLFNGLCNTVNPIISFLNGAFSQNADGSVSLLKPTNTGPLNVQGNLAVQGNSSVGGSQTVTGQTTLNGGLTSYGANVMPGTLAIQTVNGQQGGLLVQGSAAVLGNASLSTVSNNAGFRTLGPTWCYSGAVTAGNYYHLPCAGGATSNCNYYLPYAGSVTAVMVNFVSSGQTAAITLFCSGAWGDIKLNFNLSSSSPNGTYTTTFAKGTYPFVAQNYNVCKLYSSVAINSFQLNMIPVYEFTS